MAASDPSFRTAGTNSFIVRTTADPESLIEPTRQLVWSVNPEFAVPRAVRSTHAWKSRIVTMALGNGLALIGLGLLISLPRTLAATALIAHFLPGVVPSRDPLAYGGWRCS
jgi:hypothetical protein